MSDWKLRIELGAKQDIRDGFDYYKQEAGVEIARRFRDVVRAGMAKVREAPERWPVFNDEGERHYVGCRHRREKSKKETDEKNR